MELANSQFVSFIALAVGGIREQVTLGTHFERAEREIVAVAGELVLVEKQNGTGRQRCGIGLRPGGQAFVDRHEGPPVVRRVLFARFSPTKICPRTFQSGHGEIRLQDPRFELTEELLLEGDRRSENRCCVGVFRLQVRPHLVCLFAAHPPELIDAHVAVQRHRNRVTPRVRWLRLVSGVTERIRGRHSPSTLGDR